MKEHLQKIASIHADIAKAAKEGDNTTLITKLEEAAVALQEASIEAETVDTTTVTQSEDIAKMQEAISKWADMYVSADSFAKLLADMKAVTDKITGLETVTKTVEILSTRLETVEKTSLGSKQITTNEKEAVTKTTTVLGGLAARL